MKNIFITTGDSDSVGLEVTAKALHALGPIDDVHFTIYVSKAHQQQHYFNLLKQKFSLRVSHEYNPATPEKNTLNVITSSTTGTHWVEEIVLNHQKYKVDALVTGPISKVNSFTTHRVNGHTELFRKLLQDQIFMSFVGQKFNVLLLTDHMPLKVALDKIDINLYNEALKCIDQLNFKNKNIALVGINPHAGESGLLGHEENEILLPFIEQQKSNFEFSQPLPADTAFLEHNWDKYGLYFCPFHDIGLSAFKTVHGLNDGIQVSLGLPFLRTSVDHGTASDIFNKDKADFGSMQMAIEYAIKKGSDHDFK